MQPFPLLVIALADWLKRCQQNVICYLVEENRVLQEQFIGQRLLLADDQRIRLAVEPGTLAAGCLRELLARVGPSRAAGSDHDTQTG